MHRRAGHMRRREGLPTLDIAFFITEILRDFVMIDETWNQESVK
jgi:hypothetical protein